MLSYGAMIWGHRAPMHRARLRHINRMAINTLGTFPKSTPTIALEVMLDIMPLHLYCQQEGLAARSRHNDILTLEWTGTSNKKTHAVSHLRHWETSMQKLKLKLDDNDRCSTTKWNAGFKINRDSFSGEAKHRKLTQYNVYTDGSRLDDQTGAGFVIYRGKRKIHTGKYRLPNHATVFQGEITAVTKAANKLHGLNIPDMKYVKFFVDSRAAIQALDNPTIRSKTVGDAVDALNQLTTRTTSVQICWIPAHRGHKGNEEADLMAKAGAQSSTRGDKTHTPKPHSAVKADIRNGILGLWTREWLDDPSAKHTKQFYNSPCPLQAKHVYKLARLELGRFARLITGHNNLNHFQARIGLWADSNCRLCGEAEETFLHFLHDCPRLRQHRLDIFLDDLPRPTMNWSVRSLLAMSYIPVVNEAFEGTWASNDPADQNNMQSDEITSQDSEPTSSTSPTID